MFGIFLSAIYAALGWLVRTVVVKFVIFFALFFLVSEFVSVILDYLLPSDATSAANLTSAFSAQNAGVWYFLDLFQISFGVSAVMAASVTRFILRRIPVIG
jgi:ABC-type antimicrobial peptide transport system permease subunit